MINVNVKMLNGDLFSITHKPSKGFQHFVRTVYNICPHIPHGCLVLKRIVEENNFEDVEDVEDVDQLFACVDISRVQPVVEYDEYAGKMCIPYEGCKETERKDGINDFYIKFYSTTECNEDGEFLYYDEINVFYDEKEKIFALADTFKAPTPQESSCYHRQGMGCPYRSTEKTRWFTTISECLLSLENARFPQDEKTLDSIQTQIDKEFRKCNAFDFS